jgi:23S rRNA (adenine2030-N6)-methyltransferase
MLSYRHSFHAGNATDALKHSVLAFCLHSLCKKDKPFTYIDTHAGAGRYALPVDRKIEAVGEVPGVDVVSEDYRSVLQKAAPYYPGSPLIASLLMRPQDRAFCFELHPQDFKALKEVFLNDKRFFIRKQDGFKGLPPLLPPQGGRGLVLLDPPYEDAFEYDALQTCIKESLHRFPGGLYLVWYPLFGPPLPGSRRKARGDNGLEAALGALADEKHREHLTLRQLSKPASSPGMYGSCVFVINPPQGLASAITGFTALTKL